MWRPGSFGEMQSALGSVEESDVLDFKSALSTNLDKKDLGKDAAAMALYGGVIVVGVEETNGVASALSPVNLSGTVEQIQQVIASRVSPPLVPQLDVLTENDGDSDGLVVIEISASTSAPHQADGRYPARAGPTTRSLTEAEVEQWYRRRHDVQAQLPGEDMGQWLAPPNVAQTSWNGIGDMRLLVRAPGSGRHPEAPRLLKPLTVAMDHAKARCAELLRDDFATPHALDFLREWTTRGSVGWQAGMAAADFEAARRGPFVAATWTYEGAFSGLTTIPLDMEGGEGRCAYEQLWVTNLIAQLLSVGALLRDVPAAAMAGVTIELSGLSGALSFEATRGRVIDSTAQPVADTVYRASGVFPVAALKDDPRDAVRELLDPFLISFVGRDTVAWVSRV